MGRLLIRLLRLAVLELSLPKRTQDITRLHACATALQGIPKDPVS